jgi:hypothetical protein
MLTPLQYSMQDRGFMNGHEPTNGVVKDPLSSHDDNFNYDPFAKEDFHDPFPATKGAITPHAEYTPTPAARFLPYRSIQAEG